MRAGFHPAPAGGNDSPRTPSNKNCGPRRHRTVYRTGRFAGRIFYGLPGAAGRTDSSALSAHSFGMLPSVPRTTVPFPGHLQNLNRSVFNTLSNNSAAPRSHGISKHFGGMRLQGIRCAPPLRAVKTPKNLFPHNGLPARDVPMPPHPMRGVQGAARVTLR